jgi:uncharacterized protein YlxP (DUF503 family)
VTVALLSIELFLPMSQSLKDKRMVVRRVKDRLQAFNVAVAEVAHQEVWQRAGLAVVTVATGDQGAEQTLASVVDEIERVEPGLMTRTQVEFLR